MTRPASPGRSVVRSRESLASCGRGQLREALEQVRARTDLVARRDTDPVAFVHRYADPKDREIVALVAAVCAFGNVKAIQAKLTELFERVGPSPARAADKPKALLVRLVGFKHRVFRGEDLAGLIVGARRVQIASGSLGAAFTQLLSAVDAELAHEEPDVRFREALARFCDCIREAGGLPQPGGHNPSGRRGPLHMLADVRAGSAAKRLLLYLRWMVRPADGIDLGLWRVPAKRLLIPVDVHIHKLSRNLGLTRRKDVSWKTCVEITRALAQLDPEDPVRYDFSLCHMGMVQRCPSRADAARCDGCGVRPVCVHWRAHQARAVGAKSAPRRLQIITST